METNVYIANTEVLLENRDLFKKLYERVSDYRKNKIDKTGHAKDKALSLGVGILLKKALADIGLDNPNLNIEFTRYDKPELKDYPDIHFNLSHSGNRAMCVVSDYVTGCDVEEVCRRNFSIANKFFSGYEKETFNGLNDILKPDTFFRIWTMKESFIKTTGIGLAQGLGKFSVLDKDGEPLDHIMIDEDVYRFYPLDMYDGYKYALCLKNADKDVKINVIKCNLEEL